MKSPIVHEIEQNRSDDTAIECLQSTVSYYELNEQSDRLACWLLELRDREQWEGHVRIGLYMQPSHHYVITLLAILKAGMEFLPLDKNRTNEELVSCMQRTTLQLVMTEKGFELKCKEVLMGYEQLSYRLVETAMIEAEDCLDMSVMQQNIENDGLSKFAYMIYTSGSSGQPKAVHVHHDGILPRMRSIKEMMKVTREDCVAQLCALEFDASLQEIFTALISGACLKIIPDSIRKRVDKISAHLSDVTIATLVQVYIEKLDPSQPNLQKLRAIIATGSALETSDIKKWILRNSQDVVERLRFINGYGATEETIGSRLGELVVDAQGDVVNHLGECMQGIYHAYRYINREQDDDGALGKSKIQKIDKTLISYEQAIDITHQNPEAEFELVSYVDGEQNSYIDTPKSYQSGFALAFINDLERVVYYTKDVVRFDHQHRLYYQRRIGNSLKRNGKLIDLERINTVLNEHRREMNMGQVYVLADDKTALKSPGQNSCDLVLFVYCEADGFLTDRDIKQLNIIAASKLMLQEIPSHIYEFGKPLPQHPSKKTIDKRALKREYKMDKLVRKELIRCKEEIATLNPIEKEIAEIWRQVLEIKQPFDFRSDDNFLNFGAESQTIARMIHAVINKFANYITAPLLLSEQIFKTDGSLARVAREVIQYISLDACLKKPPYVTESSWLPKPIRMKLQHGQMASANCAIVLIHSLTGNAEIDYRNRKLNEDLARVYLSSDQQDVVIFTLNAPPIDGNTSMPATIEELARHYIDAIKSQCARFEYIRLVGWSAGGVIVHEILYQLQSQQDALADRTYGVMLDSLAPDAWRSMSNQNFFNFLRKVPEKLSLSRWEKIERLFVDKNKPQTLNGISKFRMIDSLVRIIRFHKVERNIQSAYVIEHLLPAILNYYVHPSVRKLVLYTAKRSEMDLSKIHLAHKQALFWDVKKLYVNMLSAQSTHSNIVYDPVLYEFERREHLYIRQKLACAETISALKQLSQNTDEPGISALLDSRAVKIEEFFVEPSIFETSEIHYGIEADTEDEREVVDTTASYHRGIKSVQLNQLLSKPKVVVTAPQGIGKTTLVRYLAYRWAMGERELVSRADLMVYVQLKEVFAFTKTYPESSHDEVVKFILYTTGQHQNDQFKHVLQSYFNVAHGEQLHLRLCFLLDGFNEVSDVLTKGESREKRLITRLIKIEHAIITTQAQSLQVLFNTLPSEQQVQLLELHGLDDYYQIQQCVHNVFKFIRSPNKRQLEQNMQKWVVSNLSQYLDILHHPMMLMLFCSMSESIVELNLQHGSIVDLYKKLVLQILKKYLVHHYGVASDRHVTEIQVCVKPLYELLMEIAFGMLMLGGNNMSVDFIQNEYCYTYNEAERRQQFSDMHMQLKTITQTESNLFDIRSTKDNYDELIKSGVIGLNRNKNTIEFLHDSIHLHLAADYLARAWKDKGVLHVLEYSINDEEYDEKPIKNIICDLLHNPNFNNCMIHLAGLLKPEVKQGRRQKRKVGQPAADTKSYQKEYFCCIFEEIEQKNKLDPLQVLRTNAQHLPNIIWVMMGVIDICCADEKQIIVFCEGSNFIDKCGALFFTMLRDSALYNRELRRDLYRLLSMYPNIKNVMHLVEALEPYVKRCKHRNNSALEVSRRISTSNEGPHLLLQQAFKEDDPVIQEKIIRNTVYFHVRLFFDKSVSSLPDGGNLLDILKYHISIDHVEQATPIPIFQVLLAQSKSIVTTMRKDPLFFSEFMSFFILFCKRVKYALEHDEASLVQQACYVFKYFVGIDDCPDEICQQIKATLKLIFYADTIIVPTLYVSTFGLGMLLDLLSPKEVSREYLDIFYAIINIFHRIYSEQFSANKLKRVTLEFWKKYARKIKKGLYIENNYDKSLLQQNLWPITKFIRVVGSYDDCKELAENMLDCNMMRESVFVGPISLLHDKLLGDIRKHVINVLEHALPGQLMMKFDKQKTARRYARALIAFIKFGEYTYRDIEQLYYLFIHTKDTSDIELSSEDMSERDSEHENDSDIEYTPEEEIEKYERIYLNIALLVLEGNLDIKPSDVNDWLIAVFDKLEQGNFVSSVSNVLYVTLIKLVSYLMTNNIEHIIRFFSAISHYLNEEQDYKIRCEVIKSSIALLNYRVVKDAIAVMPEPALIETEPSIIKAIIERIIGLRFHHPQVVEIFQNEAILNYCDVKVSANEERTRFHQYFHELIDEFLVYPQTITRVFTLRVFASHIAHNRLSQTYIDLLKPALLARVYDWDLIVRLAAMVTLLTLDGCDLTHDDITISYKQINENHTENYIDANINKLESLGFPAELLAQIRLLFHPDEVAPNQSAVAVGVLDAGLFAQSVETAKPLVPGTKMSTVFTKV